MFVFLEQTLCFHHQLLLQVGVGQPDLVKLVLQIIVGSSVVKSLPTRAGDRRCRFNPWVRKIPGEGKSNPFQYSCVENPMDRGAWWVIQSTGSQRVSHN